MLQRGDQTPHFHVTTVDGREVDYSAIWQWKNLVLVALSDESSDTAYAYASRLLEASWPSDTQLVVTRNSVGGLLVPALLIADRWGEIVFVSTSAKVKDLPPAEEISDWVDYLHYRCPECEGEAK